jgi:hypothetical protein
VEKYLKFAIVVRLSWKTYTLNKDATMGLLDGLLGNASKIDVLSVTEELAPILSSAEQVVEAYKMVRDLIVFTDRR